MLAAACSGELTREWREQQDRREPVCTAVVDDVDDDDLLDELPPTWGKVRLATVIADSFYGPRFSSEDYDERGVPTVRTSDMDFQGRLVLADAPRVRVPAGDMKKYGLQDGDLLLTRTGATIGKCALYRAHFGPAIPSAYLIRFRFDLAKVTPEYVLRFMQSPYGQRLLGIGQTSVAQPNVNAKVIGQFPFPLPPPAEQRALLRLVADLLGLADAIESRLLAAQRRTEKLPQAILSKAFSGELVPTEAELARLEGRDYEPASMLLERVKADAATGPTKKKQRATKRQQGVSA